MDMLKDLEYSLCVCTSPHGTLTPPEGPSKESTCSTEREGLWVKHCPNIALQAVHVKPTFIQCRCPSLCWSLSSLTAIWLGRLQAEIGKILERQCHFQSNFNRTSTLWGNVSWAANHKSICWQPAFLGCPRLRILQYSSCSSSQNSQARFSRDLLVLYWEVMGPMGSLWKFHQSIAVNTSHMHSYHACANHSLPQGRELVSP